MAELKRALRAPEVTTQSATPAAGKRLLYPKNDGWYEKNSAGVETKIGPAASVANMMTTDTAQTITGAKTFGVGKLLMTDGVTTAEPYSDVNAPGTLDMSTFAAGSVPTPASGKATVTTTDGSALLIKDASGVQRTVGQIVPDQQVSTDYLDTMPALPTAGLKMFTRYRGRRLPAFVGPTGQDSRLQPFFGSNRIARMASVNATTAPTLDGLAVTWLNNATATPTAVTAASTTFFTSMVRTRAATPATAGTGCGVRANTAQWFLSSTANMGGFHFVCRFGLNVATLGSRGFVGMTSQTGAYLATSDPSAQLNQIGFYWNATQNTLGWITSGSAQGSAVALGTNFSVAAGVGVNFYEVSIYAPSGGGQTVYWSITRINDGLVASGGPVTGTTTLPALGTLLMPQVYVGSGTLAAAQSVDVQSIYLESDN